LQAARFEVPGNNKACRAAVGYCGQRAGCWSSRILTFGHALSMIRNTMLSWICEATRNADRAIEQATQELDPEQCVAVFPRDKRGCAEFMLNQNLEHDGDST
jgi:hypothetical protein